MIIFIFIITMHSASEEAILSRTAAASGACHDDDDIVDGVGGGNCLHMMDART